MKTGFKITNDPTERVAKGFVIGFENGYSVSVQFGDTNLCSNQSYGGIGEAALIDTKNRVQFLSKRVAKSSTAETAIIKPNGRVLKFKGVPYQAYPNAEQVAETIAYTQSLENNNFGRLAFNQGGPSNE